MTMFIKFPFKSESLKIVFFSPFKFSSCRSCTNPSTATMAASKASGEISILVIGVLIPAIFAPGIGLSFAPLQEISGAPNKTRTKAMFIVLANILFMLGSKLTWSIYRGYQESMKSKAVYWQIGHNLLEWAVVFKRVMNTGKAYTKTHAQSIRAAWLVKGFIGHAR